MLSGKLPLRSPEQPRASSAVGFERAFVWAGGAVFVVSLAASAYAYLIVWADPRPAAAPASALIINVVLLLLFAVHHSLFARTRVKSWLAHRLPERLLRSLYVWIASLLWLAVVLAWRRIGGELFHHAGLAAIAHAAVQLAGVWMIAQSVRAIDALDLAGIRRNTVLSDLQVRGPYRLVRHPLYLGWLLVVFGAAHMTGDRLAFASMTSLYLVVAIPWEERSLEDAFGEAYARYKRAVRWRVIPYVY